MYENLKYQTNFVQLLISDTLVVRVTQKPLQYRWRLLSKFGSKFNIGKIALQHFFFIKFEYRKRSRFSAKMKLEFSFLTQFTDFKSATKINRYKVSKSKVRAFRQRRRARAGSVQKLISFRPLGLLASFW